MPVLLPFTYFRSKGDCPLYFHFSHFKPLIPSPTMLTNFDSNQFLGSTVIALSTLLGAYSLIRRFRQEPSHDSPPALSSPPPLFVTLSELDSFRAQTIALHRDTSSEIHRLRQEIKADYHYLFERLLSSFTDAHSLIQRNAQHVSALIAQQQMTNQRLSELTVKTDKLFEKLIPPKP